MQTRTINNKGGKKQINRVTVTTQIHVISRLTKENYKAKKKKEKKNRTIR